jgi:hypothetical protein
VPNIWSGPVFTEKIHAAKIRHIAAIPHPAQYRTFPKRAAIVILRQPVATMSAAPSAPPKGHALRGKRELN